MVRTIAARIRKLRGRQTPVDLAFEEWAELRAALRRGYGLERATKPGGWLDYAEGVFAQATLLAVPPETRVRAAALEVFEHVVFHGGVVHELCDCTAYEARVDERTAALRTGRRPPPPPFALPGDSSVSRGQASAS